MFAPDKPSMRERLRAGEPIGVFWSVLGSPALVEVAVEAGPDAVVLDAQHGLWSRQAIEQVVGTAGRERPILVRTADGSPRSISEALDSGAEGVIVPLVETGEQAAQAAAASRFPPEGHRSGGGVRPLKSDFGAYYRRAVERTVVGVMIETALGLQNAGEIAATPGVDFVLIGTGDLALSLGVASSADPRHREACDAIFAACRKAGMRCAIFTAGAEEAAAMAEKGYVLTVVANDLGVVSAGFSASMKRFRDQAGAGDDRRGQAPHGVPQDLKKARR